MNDLIEPCPFCGCPDIKVYSSGSYACDGGNGVYNNFKCNNCCAHVRFPEDNDDSWNTRFYGGVPCEPGDEAWINWHEYNESLKNEQ